MGTRASSVESSGVGRQGWLAWQARTDAFHVLLGWPRIAADASLRASYHIRGLREWIAPSQKASAGTSLAPGLDLRAEDATWEMAIVLASPRDPLEHSIMRLGAAADPNRPGAEYFQNPVAISRTSLGKSLGKPRQPGTARDGQGPRFGLRHQRAGASLSRRTMSRRLRRVAVGWWWILESGA